MPDNAKASSSAELDALTATDRSDPSRSVPQPMAVTESDRQKATAIVGNVNSIEWVDSVDSAAISLRLNIDIDPSYEPWSGSNA